MLYGDKLIKSPSKQHLKDVMGYMLVPPTPNSCVEALTRMRAMGANDPSNGMWRWGGDQD